MKLVNLTQLLLNDASVSALPHDIGRFACSTVVMSTVVYSALDSFIWESHIGPFS